MMPGTGTECDVECIYKLIGKEPFVATSLKDLKDAAEALSLWTGGYKLTIVDLQKTSRYAILPVGKNQGTPKDPLHFILVKQVGKHHATVINTRTLQTHTVAVAELQDLWNGYALLVSTADETAGCTRDNTLK
jgi:ABC-type bacteriocin/lantibiotic exporter with double-glycine peptidase domain